MDKREQPSIFKKHPELQPQHFLADHRQEEASDESQKAPFEELQKRQLPEGIQTRKQITQEIERFMKQRTGIVESSASSSRKFRSRAVPAYFRRSRQTLYDQVRKTRDFYEELADQLQKNSEEYILFSENTVEERVPLSTENSIAKRNHSISLRGIMDEETRSLKHQKKNYFSLFPEE